MLIAWIRWIFIETSVLEMIVIRLGDAFVQVIDNFKVLTLLFFFVLSPIFQFFLQHNISIYKVSLKRIVWYSFALKIIYASLPNGCLLLGITSQ